MKTEGLIEKNLSKKNITKDFCNSGILSKPDILLLDEPLSVQDSESQKTFISITFISSLLNSLGMYLFLVLIEGNEDIKKLSSKLYTGILEQYKPELNYLYFLQGPTPFWEFDSNLLIMYRKICLGIYIFYII